MTRKSNGSVHLHSNTPTNSFLLQGKKMQNFCNLTDNSYKRLKESTHCINKAEEDMAQSKLGNSAAHRHSPAMGICWWGAQKGCHGPLLWGTLQKYQFHKNTHNVADKRSLYPDSGLWQWPQMDTEGEEITRQAYMILPSLYSPCLHLFSGRGLPEPDRVSPCLGSSMDFSRYFSFLLSPERVLASTSSSRTTCEPDCY